MKGTLRYYVFQFHSIILIQNWLWRWDWFTLISSNLARLFGERIILVLHKEQVAFIGQIESISEFKTLLSTPWKCFNFLFFWRFWRTLCFRVPLVCSSNLVVTDFTNLMEKCNSYPCAVHSGLLGPPWTNEDTEFYAVKPI